MAIADVLKQQGPAVEEVQSGAEVHFSVWIAAFLLLMAVLLLYVWSHTNMTKLEYQLAEELGNKERLLEEQKKLKVDIATLKAPQRIEAIARTKLHMTQPAHEQIVVIK